MNDVISIIVPVYNVVKTLPRCVRSLTGQTYRNLEILLVNDGSGDESLDLCRELAGQDGRIRVIDKPNGGVSSARNAGLDAASGRFVMFCDSDDWAEPDWCGAMLEHFTEGDMTICGIEREDIPPEKGKPELEIRERKELLHTPLLMCAVYNKIYLRSVIESNRLRFPEQLSLGEDFAFVLAYVCAIDGKLRYYHRALYHYDTSNENSLSGKAPSLEQCDSFCRMVTDAMQTLGAMDGESIAVRDRFVLSHFEKLLVSVSCRDIPFRDKMALAGEIGRLDSFRCCRTKAVTWGSGIYCRLFHSKNTKAVMLFLLLRAKWKNRRSAG